MQILWLYIKRVLPEQISLEIIRTYHLILGFESCSQGLHPEIQNMLKTDMRLL